MNKIIIAGIKGYLGNRSKIFFKKKGFKVYDYKKKIPKTAPYTPEVLDRGPYALKNLKEIAGKLYIFTQCIISSSACHLVNA